MSCYLLRSLQEDDIPVGWSILSLAYVGSAVVSASLDSRPYALVILVPSKCVIVSNATRLKEIQYLLL